MPNTSMTDTTYDVNHISSPEPAKPVVINDDARLPPGANTLTFKLAMQDKKRQERRPYKYGAAACMSDMQLDEYLGNQQEKHLNRSSWRTLDMTYKWKYITEYLNERQDIPSHIKKKLTLHVKDLLQRNKLSDVCYNNKTRKIDTLGIKYPNPKDGVTIDV